MTMRIVAVAVITGLLGFAGIAAIADDAPGDAPIRIPAGWTQKLLPGLPDGFAEWKNGTATFLGNVGPAPASGVLPPENAVGNTVGRTLFPAILDDRVERLDRCSTTYSLRTTRRRQDDGSVRRTETLQYIAGTFAYLLEYAHTETGPADPNIERLIHDACPDDVTGYGVPF